MLIYILQQQSEAEERQILTLENVTHEDEGYYICSAANSLGSTAEKIYVQVLDGNIKKISLKKMLIYFSKF